MSKKSSVVSNSTKPTNPIVHKEDHMRRLSSTLKTMFEFIDPTKEEYIYDIQITDSCFLNTTTKIKSNKIGKFLSTTLSLKFTSTEESCNIVNKLIINVSSYVNNKTNIEIRFDDNSEEASKTLTTTVLLKIIEDFENFKITTKEDQNGKEHMVASFIAHGELQNTYSKCLLLIKALNIIYFNEDEALQTPVVAVVTPKTTSSKTNVLSADVTKAWGTIIKSATLHAPSLAPVVKLTPDEIQYQATIVALRVKKEDDICNINAKYDADLAKIKKQRDDNIKAKLTEEKRKNIARLTEELAKLKAEVNEEDTKEEGLDNPYSVQSVTIPWDSVDA